MTPSQKAFVDAYLDILAGCRDCMARISKFAKYAYLPISPEGLEIM